MTWPAWVCLFILLVMAGEAALLAAFHRRTGRGPTMRRVLPMLGAGAALVLALLLALLSAPAFALLPCLAAALLAHLFDLRNRWPD